MLRSKVDVVSYISDSKQEADGNSVDSCHKEDINEPPPKRPTSAYNLFFRMERRRIVDGKSDTTHNLMERRRSCFKADEVATFALQERIESNAKLVLSSQNLLPKRKHVKTHGKIGFGELARQIAVLWKNISPQEREHFEKGFQIEKDHCQSEYKKWLLRNPSRAIQEKDTKKKGRNAKKMIVCSVTDTSSISNSTCSSNGSRVIETKQKDTKNVKASRTRTLDSQTPPNIFQIPVDAPREEVEVLPRTKAIEKLVIHDGSTLSFRSDCIDSVTKECHQVQGTDTHFDSSMNTFSHSADVDHSKSNVNDVQCDDQNKSTISLSPGPSEEFASCWPPPKSFQGFATDIENFVPLCPPMRRTISVMSTQPQTGMAFNGLLKRQDDTAKNRNCTIIDPRANGIFTSLDQDIDHMMMILYERKKKLEEVRAIVAMEKDLLFQENELEKHYYVLKGLEVHRDHFNSNGKKTSCFDPGTIAKNLASLKDSAVTFNQSKSSRYFDTLSNLFSHESGSVKRQFELQGFMHEEKCKEMDCTLNPQLVHYPLNGVDTSTSNLNHDFTNKAVTASPSMLKKSYSSQYNQRANRQYEDHSNTCFYTNKDVTIPFLYSADEPPNQYLRFGIQALQEINLKCNGSAHSQYSDTTNTAKSSEVHFEQALDNDVSGMNSNEHSNSDYVHESAMYDENGSCTSSCRSPELPQTYPVHHEDGTESVYSFVDDEVTRMLLSDDF